MDGAVVRSFILATTLFFVGISCEQARAQPDPLRGQQWNLRSRTYEPAGINLEGALPTTSGAGVVVGVSDDGLFRTHPDLAPNYRSQLSYDYCGNDTDPYPTLFSETHGTMVAGVIAAAVNNGTGGFGVAAQAGLAGIRMIGCAIDDSRMALALSHQLDEIGVVNMSWGPTRSLGKPDPFAAFAMDRAVALGRQGKGRIFVKSAGNDGNAGDNCNFDGFANRRHVITVGALADDGQKASYSETCSALFLTAPSWD